jgi:O-antigen/teichoic acid export membrane protein
VTSPSTSAPTTRRAFANASIYTVGNALQLAGAALAVPVISRLIAPSEYGVVGLALTLQAVIGTVLTIGLPSAITRRYYAKDGQPDLRGAKELVVSAALIAAAGSLVAVPACALAGSLILSDGGSALALGAALGFPWAFLGAALALFVVQQRAWGFVAVTLVATVGAQLCAVIALLWLGRRAEIYLAGFLAAALAASVLAAGLLRLRGQRPARRDALSSALRLGAPMVPHTLAVFVIALGDRFVIEAIDGASAVGRYQIAYALGGLAQTLLMGVQNAWIPATFASEDSSRWKSLARTTTDVTRLASLLAGGLALTAPLGLLILAPASYGRDGLIAVTGLIAASAVPWSMYLPRLQILLWEQRTRPLLWISPAAAAINLLAAVLLVPPFGLVGAGVATVLAFAAQALFAHLATRSTPVPWDVSALRWSVVGAGALVTLGIVLPTDTAGIVARAAACAVVLGLAWIVVRPRLRGAVAK